MKIRRTTQSNKPNFITIVVLNFSKTSIKQSKTQIDTVINKHGNTWTVIRHCCKEKHSMIALIRKHPAADNLSEIARLKNKNEKPKGSNLTLFKENPPQKIVFMTESKLWVLRSY